MSDIKETESPTILCIENEFLVQQLMERVLRRKFGVNVMFVSTGEDAIKALEKKSDWDLVISDWNIDGSMNGGEILLWVMESAPHLLNKYVFLSSSEKAEAAAVGADIPIIKKPAGIQAICGTLGKFLKLASGTLAPQT